MIWGMGGDCSGCRMYICWTGVVGGAFAGCKCYFLHGFRMAHLVRIGMGERFCCL